MFSVMTLNLNYYVDRHGSWPRRLPLVREAIARASPDVIALQAVRREMSVGGGIDQASQLARLLPEYTEVRFQPADNRFDEISQGSAILSRLPVRDYTFHELSLRAGLEDDNPRLLQHAVIDLDGGKLNLFNAHFSWVQAQVRDNIDETVCVCRQADGPALLVGDMNTPPDSPLLEKLREAGLADAWALLRRQEEGHTFEADKPFTRIDYIWVNDVLRPRLEDIEIIRNSREEEGVRMSDHFGLKAAFASGS